MVYQSPKQYEKRCIKDLEDFAKQGLFIAWETLLKYITEKAAREEDQTRALILLICALRVTKELRFTNQTLVSGARIHGKKKEKQN